MNHTSTNLNCKTWSPVQFLLLTITLCYPFLPSRMDLLETLSKTNHSLSPVWKILHCKNGSLSGNLLCTWTFWPLDSRPSRKLDEDWLWTANRPFPMALMFQVKNLSPWGCRSVAQTSCPLDSLPSRYLPLALPWIATFLPVGTYIMLIKKRYISK